MNYEQQHILNWLKERPLINISKLEELSGCPKDTVRNFMKERRQLSVKHLKAIQEVLYLYGFVNINSE